MNKGDLVWIPSEVSLIKFNNLEDKTVIRHRRLEEPKHVILIGEENPYYEILYEGESWYAPIREVYNASKIS
jgi:hypothetical protein|tara:strand:- start:374 stop:589 length:216 start_codon:yes stop_codon:yes gene_type:complete